MLYASGHRIRPQDIGLLLSTGIIQIYVRKKPIVAIIPTGSEIISPEMVNPENLQAGSIIDSSSSMLAAFLEILGVTTHVTNVVPDDENIFMHLVKEEIQKCELVLIIAGSSAGREDLTSSILAKIGRVFVHGIAIAPGKPTILSSVQEKPCIGMPGYPVSTLIVAEYVLKPLIFKMLGIPLISPVKYKAVITSPLPSKLGSEEFIRVGLGKIGGKGSYQFNALFGTAGFEEIKSLFDNLI
jgi:putative molybdopterin biosynthesis protein